MPEKHPDEDSEDDPDVLKRDLELHPEDEELELEPTVAPQLEPTDDSEDVENIERPPSTAERITLVFASFPSSLASILN